MSHIGSCFCGAVEVTVTGSPEAMGYCHCRSCRSWSGGPVNAFSLWKPEAVRVTKGAEHVAKFAKTELSERTFGERHRTQLQGELKTLREQASGLVRAVARFGSAVTARNTGV